MRKAEEILKEIREWVEDYDRRDQHDSEYNMEAKDIAYAIFQELVPVFVVLSCQEKGHDHLPEDCPDRFPVINP